MANSLITVSMLANTVLALALSKNEPFDGCEVVQGPYRLNDDESVIHIRLYDRTLGDKGNRHAVNWAKAYQDGIETEGTEREITLPLKTLEFPIEEIRKRVSRAFGFSPAGRPRKWDRHELYDDLMQYIEKTDIPILAEFAYKTGITRDLLYEMPELSDAIKACAAKKEAALESKALKGDVNCTMAIFSLKQLGWTDRNEQTVQGKGGGPVLISSTDAEL